MSSFFWSSSFQCSVDLDVVTGRRLFVLYMCVYVCIERSCFKGSQELMGCRTPNYWHLVFQLIFQFDLIHAPYSWNPMLESDVPAMPRAFVGLSALFRLFPLFCYPRFEDFR